MTRAPTPKTPKTAAKPASKPAAKGKSPAGLALEVASKPVEVVGQTIERALDPLASALKRAALKRADKQSRQFSEEAAAADEIGDLGLVHGDFDSSGSEEVGCGVDIGEVRVHRCSFVQ